MCRITTGWLLLLGLLINHGATAADATLAFRYRGETRQFENLTPRTSAFCAQLPTLCGKPLEGLVQVGASYEKLVEGEHEEGLYLSRPNQPRAVQLTREGTAEQISVELEITHLGGAVAALDAAPPIATPGELRRSSCPVPSEGGAAGSLLWSMSSSACWLGSTQGQVGRYRVSDMTLGYRLNLPRVSGLKAGRYNGSVMFTLGPDRDIGLGAFRTVSALTSDAVTLNIVLEIQHDLDVRFDAGAEQVTLRPRGGWQRHADRYGLPPRLEQDLAFTLSSSGPFRVWATCSTPGAGGCALTADNGQRTPLFLAISLPGLLHHQVAVNRQPLSFGGERDALHIDLPMDEARHGRGQLHFHVLPQGQSGTGRMSPGRVYSGTVTVVFDASL